jgi:signal transduction histidine kinase
VDSYRDELRRQGDSELATCCLLAVRSGQLRGGVSCRVILAGEPTTGLDGEARVPLRSPGRSGSVEGWLLLPAAGKEPPPAGLEDLHPLAEDAAMILARHRLVRAAHRPHLALQEANASLAHDLRGHLHSALMRLESLDLELQGDDADEEEVRNHLDRIHHLLWKMEEVIGERLEPSDSTAAAAARTGGGEGEEHPIPELLREAREEEGEGAPGEALPELDIVGDLPPVRGDRLRLLDGLRELLHLGARSRDGSVITVSRAPGPGIRVELSGVLGAAPISREASEGWEPDLQRSGSPPPSLRQLVEDLGGQLWIEADGESLAEVVAILPAEGSGTAR